MRGAVLSEAEIRARFETSRNASGVSAMTCGYCGRQLARATLATALRWFASHQCLTVRHLSAQPVGLQVCSSVDLTALRSAGDLIAMVSSHPLTRSYGGRRIGLEPVTAEQRAHTRRVDEILSRILLGATGARIMQFPQTHPSMSTRSEAA